MTSPAPGWGAGLPGFPRADGWLLPVVAVGGGLAALGVGVDAKPLVLAGAAAAVIALGCSMPELVFALFLDAGGIKDAHVLSSLPIDLTVLTAAGVLAAIAVRCARQGVPSIPLPAALMVALAALVLASVLWSPDSSLGLSRALRFETLTLLGFLAPFALIRSRRSFMRLMIGLVVVGLLVASTAHPTNDVNKPLEVAGGIEIELGLDVGLGLLAALGYMLAAPKSKLRYLWLIPAGYMAWIAFASGSRGAVVAGGVALGFLFVRQYWSGIQSRLFIVALVAAVAGILTVG
ncbi:MAG TPA: hypothetical protein VIJ76_08720, partial [Galbitalea sp.]